MKKNPVPRILKTTIPIKPLFLLTLKTLSLNIAFPNHLYRQSFFYFEEVGS